MPRTRPTCQPGACPDAAAVPAAPASATHPPLLAARGQTLGTCTQADIDTWHVEHTSHHNVLRALFARSATKLTRRFELPRALIRGAAPLTQHRRLIMPARSWGDYADYVDARGAAITAKLLVLSPPNRASVCAGSVDADLQLPPLPGVRRP